MKDHLFFHTNAMVLPADDLEDYVSISRKKVTLNFLFQTSYGRTRRSWNWW